MSEKRDNFNSWRLKALGLGLLGSFFLVGLVHTLGVHYQVFR